MKIFILIFVTLAIFGCKNKTDDEVTYSVNASSEAAQQIGDAMAGIDESGGSTGGAISQNEIKSYQQAYARLNPNDVSTSQLYFNQLFPQAEAAACNTVTFSACTSSSRVRNLTGCTTNGGGTMTGNVTLNYSLASCLIDGANGASVSRVPNFSITGLRGATFTVAATSTGQSLTRTGGGVFTFANTGIRRTFVTPKGVTLLDVTTSTTGTLTVTGASRNSRTLTGTGSLNYVNNLTGISCALTPSSVAWTSACNCPTAGSFTATCSDSKTYSLTFSSTCGSATLTLDGSASTVSLDRCQL